MTRRALLLGASALGAGAMVPWPRTPAGAAASPAEDPLTSPLAAYVSTLVPGPADDPTGSPGAVEAGGVDALATHAPYVIPLVVADVDAAALAAHGQPFASLTYAQREPLLVAAFADPSRSPYHLIALAIGAGAFYGDFSTRVGGTHMGFPGPSDGYLDTYTDRTGHGQPEALAIPA